MLKPLKGPLALVAHKNIANAIIQHEVRDRDGALLGYVQRFIGADLVGRDLSLAEMNEQERLWALRVVAALEGEWCR